MAHFATILLQPSTGVLKASMEYLFGTCELGYCDLLLSPGPNLTLAIATWIIDVFISQY